MDRADTRQTGLCEGHHAQVMALKELYPKDPESGAYPAPPAAEESKLTDL